MQFANGQAFLWPRSNWFCPWFRHREHNWSFLTSPLRFPYFELLFDSRKELCSDFSSIDLLRTRFNFSPGVGLLSDSLLFLISYRCIAISFAMKLWRSFVTRHLSQEHNLWGQCFLWPFRMTRTPWFRQRAQTCKFLMPPITSCFNLERRDDNNTKTRSWMNIILYVFSACVISGL